MHLGNGAVTPDCAVLSLGIAAAGAGFAWRSVRNDPQRRVQALTAGVLGSAVFAAQMFNVQVLSGVSAHLVGGVLLAWIVGPALGLLTMAAVLTLQAALLGDGGLMALGANIINMAIAPALTVAAIRRYASNHSPQRQAMDVGIASFFSIVIAAGLIVAQVAAFRSAADMFGIGLFAGQMISTHAMIGLWEAVVTVSLLMLLGGLRVSSSEQFELRHHPARLAGLIGMTLAVVGLTQTGMVSGMADGYESALQHVASAGFAMGSIQSTEALTGWSAIAQAMQDGWQLTFLKMPHLLTVSSTLLAGISAWLLALWSAGEIRQASKVSRPVEQV